MQRQCMLAGTQSYVDFYLLMYGRVSGVLKEKVVPLACNRLQITELARQGNPLGASI